MNHTSVTPGDATDPSGGFGSTASQGGAVRGCIAAEDPRGSESTMGLWLHCSPDGVVVRTSVTPSGAPAVRQNAVISPHAPPLKAAAIASTTAVRLIGL